MSSRAIMRLLAASAMVVSLLTWSVPAHAQHQSSDMIKQTYDLRKQSYDVSKTVTIEAEVIGFALFDANAQITLNPVGELKSSGAFQVNWHSTSSLGNQGITSDWLKPGDRVVVTGHPLRGAGNLVRLIFLKTITRSSDGRKWADGASSTSTPPSTASSGAPSAPAPPPFAPAAASTATPAAPAGPAQSGSATSTSSMSAERVTSQADSTSSTDLDPAASRFISALVDRLTLAERRGWSAQQKQWFIECAGREYAARVKEFLALPQVKASGTTTVDVNERLGQDLVNAAFSACQLQVPAAGGSAGAKPVTASAAPSPTASNPGVQGTTGSPTEPATKAASNAGTDARTGVFTGAWVVVRRSGRGADAYMPGHLAESSMLHIRHTGELLTLGKTSQQQFTTYRLDGVEHPFSWTRPNTPPDQATTTGTVVGTRDGNRIVVDIKVKYPATDGRSAAAKRVFSLAPDGGLLIETSGGFFDHEGSLQHDLNGTWLYKRFDTETPVPQTPSTTAAKPTASATLPPAAATTTAAMPAPKQTETLAGPQEKINKDVSDKTASIVADLKKKADAQLAQTAEASQAASQAAPQPPGATGQSAGASAGPAWQPCGGDLRSGASQSAVPVEFVNTSKQPRKLYWFDFAGAKIVAGVLKPGQRAPMQTYMTHAWMIADGSDQCMGTLVISKAGSIEIR